MTDCFITKATWAADGSLVDVLISKDAPTSHLNNGIDERGVHLAAHVTPAGQVQAPAGATIIDGTGQILLPGLTDLHARVSQSGKSSIKTVKLASQAAQQGGVTALLAMPSKSHMFDNPAALDSFRDIADELPRTDMVPAGCITLQCEGVQQSPYNTLAGKGISIFTDGDIAPSNMLMLYRAMQYIADLGLTFALRADVPAISKDCYVHRSTSSYMLGMRGLPACAEEIGTETILRLAADTQAKIHLQCVSTVESVNILRRNKGNATAEVALHHLLFTHADIGDFDTTYKTLPPLRGQTDCEALLDGIKDGTIDCIVSDHCPCSPFAKKQEFPSAPQGMIGLDTYLPSLYTKLVKTGKLSWAQLIQACCVRPAAILKGETDSALPVILFNPAETQAIQAETLPSGTLNSPYLGQELEGKVSFIG
ncbi:MAG: dihydroorotase [Akkermansia sp.]